MADTIRLREDAEGARSVADGNPEVLRTAENLDAAADHIEMSEPTDPIRDPELAEAVRYLAGFIPGGEQNIYLSKLRAALQEDPPVPPRHPPSRTQSRGGGA